MTLKVRWLIYAFSIMPDHIYAVIACQSLDPDEVIACLKRASTRGLNAQGLHPFKNSPRSNGKLPSPWAEGGWKVFLDTSEEMQRAIQYVEQNPIRSVLKAQHWPFVVPFAG
jgi:REP element-mobilizing transposase RayT